MAEPIYDIHAAKADSEELVRLLGEPFQRKVTSAERGLKSKTPPSDAQVHTLARAVVRLRTTPDEFVPSAGSAIDLDRQEVRTVLGLIRQWECAPEWVSLATKLCDEYEHTLGSLAVLRWLDEHK